MPLTREPIFTSVKTGEFHLSPHDTEGNFQSSSLKVFTGYEPQSDPSGRRGKLWYSDGSTWHALEDLPTTKFSPQKSAVVGLDLYVSNDGDDSAATIDPNGSGIWTNISSPFQTLEGALNAVRELGYNDWASITISGGIIVTLHAADYHFVSLDTGYKGAQKTPLVIKGELDDSDQFNITEAYAGEVQSSNFSSISSDTDAFGEGNSDFLGEKIVIRWTDPESGDAMVASHLLTLSDGPTSTSLCNKDFDMANAVNSGVAVTAKISRKTSLIACPNRINFHGGRNRVIFRDIIFGSVTWFEYDPANPFTTSQVLTFTNVSAGLQNVRFANFGEHLTNLYLCLVNSTFEAEYSDQEDIIGGGVVFDGVEDSTVPYMPLLSTDLFGTMVQMFSSSFSASEVCIRGPVSTEMVNSRYDVYSLFSTGGLTTSADSSSFSLRQVWMVSPYILDWRISETVFQQSAYLFNFSNSTVVFSGVFIDGAQLDVQEAVDTTIVRTMTCSIDFQDVVNINTYINSNEYECVFKCYDIRGCHGTFGTADTQIITADFTNDSVTDFAATNIENSNLKVGSAVYGIGILNPSSNMVCFKATASTLWFDLLWFVNAFSAGQSGLVCAQFIGSDYSMPTGAFNIFTTASLNESGVAISSIDSIGSANVVLGGCSSMCPGVFSQNAVHDGRWYGENSCDVPMVLQSGAVLSSTAGSDNLILGSDTQIVVGQLPIPLLGVFVFDNGMNEGPQNATGCMMTP